MAPHLESHTGSLCTGPSEALFLVPYALDRFALSFELAKTPIYPISVCMIPHVFFGNTFAPVNNVADWAGPRSES